MNDAEERVILVDENDQEIGLEPKLAAHQKGLLHRAFSIYVRDAQGKLIMQRRAPTKYHSGGLWTNTCCGHPRPGEDTTAAAHRRLGEEMGFDCELREVTSLTYRAELDKGMTEHEFLHVFVGTFEGEPVLNPEEADSYARTALLDLERDMADHPDAYTAWLKICLPRIASSL